MYTGISFHQREKKKKEKELTSLSYSASAFVAFLMLLFTASLNELPLSSSFSSIPLKERNNEKVGTEAK